MTNKEFNDAFRKRTQRFAIAIIKLIETIPYNSATRIVTYQLGKSGTSIGANFRAFCRARSANERFAKICIVVEEADESIYWLEICNERNYGEKEEVLNLITENLEILKVMGAIKEGLFPK